MNKSGLIQAVIAAIFAFAIVIWLQFSVFARGTFISNNDPSERLESTNSNSGDALKQSIEALNSSCPRQMDSQTRLDSALYRPGNVFAEYFTLVNLEKASIDTADMKSRIEENILGSIKTNAAFTLFKNSNYTFAFIYNDKADAHLFDIIIGPGKYNN